MGKTPQNDSRGAGTNLRACSPLCCRSKKGLLTQLPATLYFLHFQRSDRQALAALGTTTGKDLAAVLGAHALQETMHAAALTLLGLESTLHFSFLLLNSRYGRLVQGFAHTGAALQS